MKKWKYYKVAADSEKFDLLGYNVWEHAWKLLGENAFIVPHPSYPDQRHILHSYYIEVDGVTVRFAAGELSNCVWCFYVWDD